MALGLALTVAVTRLLGVANAGTYFLALAAMQLAIIVGIFGMNTTVLAELPGRVAAEDADGIAAIHRQAVRIVLVISLASTVGLVAFAPLLDAVIGAPRLVPTVWTMALAVSPTALATLYSAMLVAIGRLHIGVAIQGPLAPALTLPLFLLFRRDLTGISTAHVVAAVVSLAVAIVAWHRSAPPGDPAATDAPPPQLWPAGRSLFMLDLFNYVGSTGDVLLLGVLGSVEAVSIYAVSVRVAKVLAMVIEATNVALAPELSRHHARGDAQRLAFIASRATWVLAALGATVLAALFVFADPVLTLFGEAFAAGRTVLLVAALGATVNLATGPNGLVLKMTGHERLVRNIGGMSLLLHLALLIPLAGLHGALGAAWARTAALAVNNGSCIVAIRRRLDIDPLRGTVLRSHPRDHHNQG